MFLKSDLLLQEELPRGRLRMILLGTSRPYPDDTFYSVGRVPRKLLMKYLGIKMYLVRLRSPPALEWVGCREGAELAMACAGILSSPTNNHRPQPPART